MPGRGAGERSEITVLGRILALFKILLSKISNFRKILTIFEKYFEKFFELFSRSISRMSRNVQKTNKIFRVLGGRVLGRILGFSGGFDPQTIWSHWSSAVIKNFL